MGPAQRPYRRSLDQPISRMRRRAADQLLGRRQRATQAPRRAAIGSRTSVGVGFTGAEALWAVTSVAADACRVGDRKGRIAPGYDADLLAVVSDPLTDP